MHPTAFNRAWLLALHPDHLELLASTPAAASLFLDPLFDPLVLMSHLLVVAQALQYMRALCSHPLLALDASNPAHVELATSHTGTASWAEAQLSLRDLQHSPKLLAFR